MELGRPIDSQRESLNQQLENFLNVAKLLKEKYLNIDSDQNTTISLKKFFKYLGSTWIQSMESNWFQGTNDFGVSNHQGIEKCGFQRRKSSLVTTYQGIFCALVTRYDISPPKKMWFPESKIFPGNHLPGNILCSGNQI